MVGRFDSARGACSAKHGMGGMMDSWRDKWIAAAEYWRAKGELQYARACQVHADDADLFTEDEHRAMYGVGPAR
jgi:hypothetical protein